MKKLLTIFAAALAMLATSCIELHSKLTLNKDGSGTVTEETTFGAAAAAMMGQMGGEEGTDSLAEMADEKKAKEAAASMGEGVTLKKIEKVDADGRKGVRVTYAFEDINKLKYTFGSGMSEMGEGMNPEAEEKEEEPMVFTYKDGVLSLKNPDAAKEGEAVAEEAVEEEEDEMDDASLEMAKQMMGDMKMSLKIELPGGIAETNASHVDGNTVTFMEMEMGKLLEDPEKFKQLNKAEPQSPAEMQKALEGIEGVKVETKEEITIKLK